MNPTEFMIIVIVAFVVIGPERLPHYLAKARRLVREVKKMADGAKGQLREQIGPEFDEIDWKAYDPRQYDPRRIVREALFEDPDEDAAPSAGAHAAQPVRPRSGAVYDPNKLTPFDDEAT
ncbi:Sec-independent protein translocase family protein [Gephyromycinifex aptenodytis]|uniref:preprotein translocase subunit TatA n=1 Tax=Gephyromycinifex aptenodytis TaxID=2716227 RepID=UPI001446BF7D|nr:preprotein translocase subunit TatA [Gephyromycinifex aptenodytis]